MGKILDQIFSWNEEELRTELCIEFRHSDSLRLTVSQIIDKFRTIEEMMQKQIEVHKRWDLPLNRISKQINGQKSRGRKK